MTVFSIFSAIIANLDSMSIHAVQHETACERYREKEDFLNDLDNFLEFLSTEKMKFSESQMQKQYLPNLK